MLYLVATPIGNLRDITLRALEIFKECDYILCEDTRHSLKLLSHYQISKPLKSYHQHNEQKRTVEAVADLKKGAKIALITDAGTPGISDPGALLVLACREENILVQSIPGACAAILALASSGLDTTRFQFMGFLPKKSGDLAKTLEEAFAYRGTTIFYESPKRLLSTLKKMHDLFPLRTIAIARELTKMHEESLLGTALDLLKRWDNESPKGEFVLMISPNLGAKENSWEHLTPIEHVHFLQKTRDVSEAEAIKLTAKIRGVPKNHIYSLFHKI